MAFKQKGWKAFTTTNHSNNKSDGRAGSSAFQLKSDNGDALEASKKSIPKSMLELKKRYEGPKTYDPKKSKARKTDRTPQVQKDVMKDVVEKITTGDHSKLWDKAKKIAETYFPKFDAIDEKSPMKLEERQMSKKGGQVTKTDKPEHGMHVTKGTGVVRVDSSGNIIKGGQVTKPRLKRQMKSKVTQVTKKNPNIHTGPRDWEPAFEGADHSMEDLKTMSTKDIMDYYNVSEKEVNTAMKRKTPKTSPVHEATHSKIKKSKDSAFKKAIDPPKSAQTQYDNINKKRHAQLLKQIAELEKNYKKKMEFTSDSLNTEVNKDIKLYESGDISKNELKKRRPGLKFE